ncbi:hypothetical protein OSTOST_08273 [Ostertagia ostertagi]
MLLALVVLFSVPLVHTKDSGEECMPADDLRDVIVTFVSNPNMQWSTWMANDAQAMMAKWPYHAVFCTRPFETDHPDIRDEVVKTLTKCGPLLAEKPHTTTKFGCGCKHRPGNRKDLVQILCLFPSGSNN